MAEVKVCIYAVGRAGVYTLELERPKNGAYVGSVWSSVQKPDADWSPLGREGW